MPPARSLATAPSQTVHLLREWLRFVPFLGPCHFTKREWAATKNGDERNGQQS